MAPLTVEDRLLIKRCELKKAGLLTEWLLSELRKCWKAAWYWSSSFGENWLKHPSWLMT